MSENEQHDDYEPGAWDWVNDQVQAYEASGGTDTATLQGTDYPIIVVHTVGAKSGKLRKIGLMKVEDGGDYALVASKGGMPTHPDWYHNVLAHPDEVAIQDGAESFPVQVREVEGDERPAGGRRGHRTEHRPPHPGLRRQPRLAAPDSAGLGWIGRRFVDSAP